MGLEEYNGGQLVAVTAVFLPITWISVLLRSFVRSHITKSFQADDWLLVASQIVFSITCVFILVGIHYGIGRHDSTLVYDRKMEARKYEALATMFYILNVLFIKLSIAYFLLRIAVQKRYEWILKISMVIVTLWSLGILFFDVFRCSPVEAQWNAAIPHTCASGQSFRASSYALSIMTIISDFLYALLPIPMIWSVKMTKQAKVTVAIILSLGIFASVATLIRVKYLVQIADLQDVLFAATNSFTWSVVEPGTAITAASLVTIRPLLRACNITGFGSDATPSRPTQPQNITPRSGFQAEVGNVQSNHTSQRQHGAWPPKRTQAVNINEFSDGGSEEYILEGIGASGVGSSSRAGAPHSIR